MAAQGRWVEAEILSVLLKNGGGAQWKTLRAELKDVKMSTKTISAGLKRLIEVDILSRVVKEIEGRPGTWYELKEEPEPPFVGAMWKTLQTMAEEAEEKLLTPGLNRAARYAVLRDAVERLLDHQAGLTLLAIKKSISAPNTKKALHRFFVLMDTFTPHAAGYALGLLWLNRDAAGRVLEAMLLKGEG